MEAAQESAQPHLLEEALVLLQRSHVVTESEKKEREKTMDDVWYDRDLLLLLLHPIYRLVQHDSTSL